MCRDFSIRTATPADAAAVGAVLAACYPVLMASAYEADVLAATLPLMTRANPRLLASGTYYVAVLGDGSVVGCGGWTRERPGPGDIVAGLAHIRHFATHPGHLRRGIGGAIFGTCERAARAAGLDRFECYASLNAEAFYAALGFQRIRPLRVPMGPAPAFPSILMECPIRA